MADDSEMSSDPQMLREDGGDVGIDLEDGGKVLEAEDLEVTDETKEDTDEEYDGGSVKPGEKLHATSYYIAHYDITQEGDL